MTQDVVGRATGSYRFTKKQAEQPRYCQSATCPHRQQVTFKAEQMVKVGELYFCFTCAPFAKPLGAY